MINLQWAYIKYLKVAMRVGTQNNLLWWAQWTSDLHWKSLLLIPNEICGPDAVFEVKKTFNVNDPEVSSTVWYGFGPEERSWQPAESIDAPALIHNFHHPHGGQVLSPSCSPVTFSSLLCAAYGSCLLFVVLVPLLPAVYFCVTQERMLALVYLMGQCAYLKGHSHAARCLSI